MGEILKNPTFEKFFTAEFIANKFENFLQSISLKKYLEFFSENPKKMFCAKKKRVRGTNVPFFPVKSDSTFRWVLMCKRTSVESNFTNFN